MKTERLALVPFVAFAALLLLIEFDVKSFSLNAQATEMWRFFRNDPLGALLSGHPHGLRYLVYYPAFLAAQAFQITADQAFSYYCAIIAFLAMMYASRIAMDLWGANSYVERRAFLSLVIFALALVMNGRLLFAYCGYMLIVFVAVDWFKHRRWGLDNVIALIMGCFFASVSSGTLIIAMALAGVTVAIMLLREPSTLISRFQVPLSIGLVLVLFSVPALIGINKNLVFFGGGPGAIVEMLSHGAGGGIARSVGLDPDEAQRPAESAAPATSAASPAPTATTAATPAVIPDEAGGVMPALRGIVQYWWVGVSLVCLGAMALGWRPIKMVREASAQENVVHFAVALAVVGGLFGYSVLTMAILPTILLFSRYIRSPFPPKQPV